MKCTCQCEYNLLLLLLLTLIRVQSNKFNIDLFHLKHLLIFITRTTNKTHRKLGYSINSQDNFIGKSTQTAPKSYHHSWQTFLQLLSFTCIPGSCCFLEPNQYTPSGCSPALPSALTARSPPGPLVAPTLSIQNQCHLQIFQSQQCNRYAAGALTGSDELYMPRCVFGDLDK